MKRNEFLFKFFLTIILPAILAGSGLAQPFRLLTFNVGGIPWFHPAPDKDGRLARIAERLSRSSYDAVALQEVWFTKDVMALWKKSGFPYAAHRSGPFANRSGLMILSRYPIAKSHFYRFSADSPFANFFDGDFWGKKGILAVRMEIEGKPVNFFTTHMVATSESLDHARLRHVQIFDLSRAIEDFSGSDPYLVTGDLNFTPTAEGYGILTDGLNMADACPAPRGACPPTDEEGRLDYIFLSFHFSKNSVMRFAKDFTWEEAPRYWYSDHEGVAADIFLDFRPQAPAAGRRKGALMLIRKSIFENLADLAMRPVWWNQVPVLNLYYSFYLADRFITFVTADRELLALLYQNQRDVWRRWKKKA